MTRNHSPDNDTPSSKRLSTYTEDDEDTPVTIRHDSEATPPTVDGPATYTESEVTIINDDALNHYETWEAPDTIISDGAYGTGSFPGEPTSVDSLESWYRPHVAAWTAHATPATTLWFWNTEEGWAEIHPLLKDHGWEYRGCNTWDKGIAHIAGNSNTQKMRKFPQVTEVCVQYVRSREAVLELEDEQRDVQQWLRDEWQRTGLSFNEANDACGVASAATRKYLAADTDWYFPPPDRFQQLREYANKHGDPDGRPYLSPDGLPFDPNDVSNTGASVLHRATFNCPAGVTNVWSHPQVNGEERLTDTDGNTLHPNQKPLALIRRVIRASTNTDAVVWEPFGGVCTGAVAAKELCRTVYTAELVSEYYNAGVDRVQQTTQGAETENIDQSTLDGF